MVAGLLDYVLQAHEGRVIVRKLLLQGLDGFCDLLTILAGWPLALLRTDEAIGEDGVYQGKHLLAARLCPQNAPGRFTLTAKLAVTVRVRRTRHGHHLLPGGSAPLPHELVQPRPQAGEQRIDHGTAAVQEPQGICLRLIWQPQVVAQGLNDPRPACMFSPVTNICP